jgi:hypothetical protein
VRAQFLHPEISHNCRLIVSNSSSSNYLLSRSSPAVTFSHPLTHLLPYHPTLLSDLHTSHKSKMVYVAQPKPYLLFHTEQTCRSSAFSKENINGVYIPSALLLVGVAIVKFQWLPYAILFASLVGGYKIFASGTSPSLRPSTISLNPLTTLQVPALVKSSSQTPSKSSP